MTFNTTLRRVLRNLIRRKSYSILFCITATLGLLGLVLLNALDGSIRGSLSSKSRELLTADLSISVRRLTSEEERERIDRFVKEQGARSTRSLDVFSMLESENASQLVQVIAIEDSYPLIGRLKLEKSGLLTGTDPKPLSGGFKVWVDRDLRDSVFSDSPIGRKITLGGKILEIQDVLIEDTANAWRSFSIAPRVFISVDTLLQLGLIKKGSTLWDRTYLLLPPEKDPNEVSKIWNSITPDHAIRSTSHREASEQIAKVTSRLNDYLGLIGITTLFLASIGVLFVLQTELQNRKKSVGLLRSLGDSPRRIGFELALEGAVLGLVSGCLALGFSLVLLPVLTNLIQRGMGIEIHAQLDWKSSALTLLLSSVYAGFLTLPYAQRLGKFPPSVLITEGPATQIRPRPQSILSYLPILIFFYALSCWQSHSFRVGSLFFLAISISVGASYGLASLGLSFLDRFRVRNLFAKWWLRSIARHPTSSTTIFIALVLGTTLLSIVPQLRSVMQRELEGGSRTTIPTLFLFDIQPDQVSQLGKWVKENGAQLAFQSPLVRARLESINGEKIEPSLELGQKTTREQDDEERSRNRGFNLSYRMELSDSERLVEGRTFSGPFQELAGRVPEVSLEKEFARRLGVSLGDRLVFDVQGVPISAVVVGLRKVSWASFQPNFFVVFQPGVLEDAPQTFLAGVLTESEDPRVWRTLQSKIVKKFPNISALRSRDALLKLKEIFRQVEIAVLATAALSLLTGFFVIYSIAFRQAIHRSRTTLLLRSLGVERRRALALFITEFFVLALVACLLGNLLASLMIWFLSWQVFNDPDMGFPWVSLVITSAISLWVAAIAFWSSRRLFQAPLWKLLQAEGEG